LCQRKEAGKVESSKQLANENTKCQNSSPAKSKQTQIGRSLPRIFLALAAIIIRVKKYDSLVSTAILTY